MAYVTQHNIHRQLKLTNVKLSHDMSSLNDGEMLYILKSVALFLYLNGQLKSNYSTAEQNFFT